MQNLILIDDHKLRAEAFSRTGQLMKELTRLELHVAAFEAQDQRLYRDWFDLTFRVEREQISAMREEHQRLVQLYNWTLALAELEDLSFTTAARRIQREEERYKNGTLEEQQEIDHERKLRDDFIREQTRRRESPEAESDLDPSTAREFLEDLEELKAISEMSDDEIRAWCDSSEVAFDWLARTLRASQPKLFLRVWDLTPAYIQDRFSKRFRRLYKEELRDYIEEIREQNEFEAKQKLQAPTSNSPKSSSGETRERLKLIYRQLVRKLHPDIQREAHTPWHAKMWMKAQEAYSRGNHEELDRLLRFAHLRSQELNNLLLSEIHDSREWLMQEIAQTKAAIKVLKRSPAWGFSRRKDFSPVLRRIQKELAAERAALKEQVMDLSEMLSFT